MFYRLGEVKKKRSANVPIEPDHLTIKHESNPAYGVVTAADDDPYHVYDTIPDVDREYEVPNIGSKLQVLVQPPTNNDP